jgi:uncharacterized protein YcbK (DUF882 family)
MRYLFLVLFVFGCKSKPTEKKHVLELNEGAGAEIAEIHFPADSGYFTTAVRRTDSLYNDSVMNASIREGAPATETRDLFKQLWQIKVNTELKVDSDIRATLNKH